MLTYVIVIVLITFSALFSGLTLGLMGLSVAELKRKKSLGDKEAAKVYRVRKKGNLLLTTLLVGNVAVNSALSIFLGSIASGFAAGLIATSLIVIFGEITPQAIFSRFALKLGAKTAWLVRTFIFILYPICRPISWVLDKTLGEELPTLYSKQELMKIIEEHEDLEGSEVDEDEEKIIKGALTFSEKFVEDVMTPRVVMETLEYSQKIDEKLLKTIQNSSFSRFPVYKDDPDNIVGMLFISQLLGSKNIGKKVGEVASGKVFFVDENKSLDIVFNSFLKSHNHLFIAVNEFGDVVGLVTLEDILEEIISAEIVDESDVYEDLRKLAKEKKKTDRRSV